MAMLIENKYEIGETLYLKTDKDQLPRIVYCFKVYKNEILYELVCGVITSGHYEFELSKDINVLMQITS